MRYRPFAASSQMLAAARNQVPLRQGQWNPAVALLQGALLDLGFDLQKSIRKKGVPDGIFGWETLNAVKKFQAAHALKPDGLVGRRTAATLDAKISQQAKPLPATLPAARPLPSTKHYELGTADPRISPDRGAGVWNSTPKGSAYGALKAAICAILPDAMVVIGYDAVKHMVHYLANSGDKLEIDLEKMLSSVPSARQTMIAEAEQAQEFVELLPLGKHSFTSRSVEGAYNSKDESWNWYFATGGYVSWGKGDVTISAGPNGREYDMSFEYKFFDRYNWDKGKSATLFNITVTDEFMGEFHRQGWAREFDCVGSVKRRFSWRHGAMVAAQQYDRSIGGRS